MDFETPEGFRRSWMCKQERRCDLRAGSRQLASACLPSLHNQNQACSNQGAVISPRASQTISSSQPKRGPFITATHVVLNIDFYAVMNDVFLADKKL